MKRKTLVVSLAVLIVLSAVVFLPKSAESGFAAGRSTGEVTDYEVAMFLGAKKSYEITLISKGAPGNDTLKILQFEKREMFESVLKMLRESGAGRVHWNEEMDRLLFQNISLIE